MAAHKLAASARYFYIGPAPPASGPMQVTPVNLRAYGIWLGEDGRVLLCRERFRGGWVVKFPGGGLEPGEGLAGCLQREFLEETGLEIEIIRHYYTTDFFVPDLTDPSRAVVSVYFLVKPVAYAALPAAADGALEFFWAPLEGLEPGALSLPIDKEVARRLRADFTLLVPEGIF